MKNIMEKVLTDSSVRSTSEIENVALSETVMEPWTA